MTGRPSYIAADVPYLLERDTTAGHLARARMEQRRLAHERGSCEDNGDSTYPYYGPTCYADDLRPIDRGFAGLDRGFYPAPKRQNNDLDLLDPGRRGRLDLDHSPYYAADQELEYNPRGRLHHDQITNDAAGEELEFGRHGRRTARGPPIYDASDEESIFDEERRRDYHRRGLRVERLPSHAGDRGTGDYDEGSLHDMIFSPRNPYPRCVLGGSCDIGLDHLEGLEPRVRRSLEPRLDNYDGDEFGMRPRGARLEVGRAGRYRTGYRFEDDFEDDDLDDNLGEARHSHRRTQMLRTNRPRPAANFSDGGLENFAPGRRRHLFRPRQTGNQQSPRQTLRDNEKFDRFIGKNQPAPTTYDSITPAVHFQTESTAHTNRPPNAAAAADRIAGAEKVLPFQEDARNPVCKALNGGPARDGAGAVGDPNNPSAGPRAAPADCVHAPRVIGGDDGRSDSSDSGYDTPDDGSESCDGRSERGGILQSFIHITL